MKEGQKPKFHCKGCGKTVAIDDKDTIEIKCPKCGEINIVDKSIHSAKKHIKKDIFPLDKRY